MLVTCSFDLLLKKSSPCAMLCYAAYIICEFVAFSCILFKSQEAIIAPGMNNTITGYPLKTGKIVLSLL